MKKSALARNLGLMVAFAAVAVVLFSENVRTVQILGLFSCGAVFGASLAAIVSAFRSKHSRA